MGEAFSGQNGVNQVVLAKPHEVGRLGVPLLKRMWSRTCLSCLGVGIERMPEDDWDKLVLNALGLGLHQTYDFLFANTPTFAEFEDWIVAVAGKPGVRVIQRLQAKVQRLPPPTSQLDVMQQIESMPDVLSKDDLLNWREQGYVIVKNAVNEEQRDQAEAAIWSHIRARAEDPTSWYQAQNVHGIMVELIQHQALQATRNSPRLHKAFAQLWETSDLWVSADRCGFHPPQRTGEVFPGPDLHWDLDFGSPLQFGTQGILYLTDTLPQQGALTLVPGFHRQLPDWLAALPGDDDPQQQDLHALGSTPVGADAGDLIIWHQWLPHGSRPNLGNRPRIVQYINMHPG